MDGALYYYSVIHWALKRWHCLPITVTGRAAYSSGESCLGGFEIDIAAVM